MLVPYILRFRYERDRTWEFSAPKILKKKLRLHQRLAEQKLGGGNSKIFYVQQFNPKIGEMIQFDSYFSDGLVQPPSRKS